MQGTHLCDGTKVHSDGIRSFARQRTLNGTIWSIVNATTFSFAKVNIVDGGESAQQFPSGTRQGSKVNAMFRVGSIGLKVLMANDM